MPRKKTLPLLEVKLNEHTLGLNGSIVQLSALLCGAETSSSQRVNGKREATLILKYDLITNGEREKDIEALSLFLEKNKLNNIDIYTARSENPNIGLSGKFRGRVYGIFDEK